MLRIGNRIVVLLTSSILPTQPWKSPDITQSYCIAKSRKNKLSFASPFTSIILYLVVFIIRRDFSLSNKIIFTSRNYHCKIPGS